MKSCAIHRAPSTKTTWKCSCSCLIAMLALVAMGTRRCTNKKMYDVGGGPQAIRTHNLRVVRYIISHSSTVNPHYMTNSWSLCSSTVISLQHTTRTACALLHCVKLQAPKKVPQWIIVFLYLTFLSVKCSPFSPCGYISLPSLRLCRATRDHMPREHQSWSLNGL